MKTKDKNLLLKPISENIPDELKSLRQWVCWGVENHDGVIKKPLYNPVTRKRASPTNAKDWSDFKTAMNTYGNGNKFDGIGFVLTANDQYVGWDIDNCRNPEDGIIKPDIHDLIRDLNSYTEISPSGTGVRIFVKAKLPRYGRKKGNFEVYESGRYLTLTGHHLDHTPLSIENRENENCYQHSKIFGKNENFSTLKTSAETHQKILQKAFRSKNGHEIKKLFNANISGYNSQSEADLALCGHLAFWFKKDEILIDQVFRSSGLYREKWDEKRGDKTYGEKTINKACDSCTETFQEYQSIKTKDLGIGLKASNSLLTDEGITARDLMKLKLPAPTWAIPDLLPEGLNILGGKPKHGKSILVTNIGLSVAFGGKALGHIKVEKGDVLYLALEDTKRRLKVRLNEMLQGKQAPVELRLYTHCLRMGQGGLKFLENEIKKYPETRLVIIDTLAKFRPAKKGQKGSYELDYEDISKIKDLADRHSISILLVHHLRKADADDVMETFSGTLGLTGAADGLLALVRKTGQADAELHITGRDVETAKYALRFNASFLLWEVLGKPEDVKPTQKRQKLYNAIKISKEPISPKKLSETTGLPTKYVQKTLPSLIKQGNIKKIERGKYIYFDTVGVWESQEQPTKKPVLPKRRRRISL